MAELCLAAGQGLGKLMAILELPWILPKAQWTLRDSLVCLEM